ncbi:MAG: hypothetical protein AAFZ80_08900 [Cyanobacteria bacterium P01_A01_bin.105]
MQESFMYVQESAALESQNFSAIDCQHAFNSFAELTDVMLHGKLPQPDQRGIIHVTVDGNPAPFYASLLSKVSFSKQRAV